MAKYTVHFHQMAAAGVTVEVDDEETEELTREKAIEKAYDELPTGICAQCGGWGQDWYLSLDGEWELDTSDGEFPAAERVERC